MAGNWREGLTGSRSGAGELLRESALGVLGTAVLAVLLLAAVGPLGVVAAVVVGVVWGLVGGPYAYALGQVFVVTLTPVALDDPVFLPVQGALLLVCFGRLLSTARLVETTVAAVGSLVVVGALLVVSLGSVASLWQSSILLLAAAAVATALLLWYEPATETVERV